MTDTPKTRLDLIDRALENLGILVEGQAPTAEMRQKVDRVIDPRVAELRVDEVIYLADVGTTNPPAGGQIPVECFLALADVIAWAAAPSFSLAGDPSLKVLGDLGEDRLRTIARPPKSRRMLRTDTATRPQGRGRPGSFSRGT